MCECVCVVLLSSRLYILYMYINSVVSTKLIVSLLVYDFAVIFTTTAVYFFDGEGDVTPRQKDNSWFSPRNSVTSGSDFTSQCHYWLYHCYNFALFFFMVV